MSLSLSRFSIQQQILIGFVPVLLILAFLAFSSFKSFQKFDQSFYDLKAVTKEGFVFLAIERDTVELQRNVLVYSYVGYNGVLRKIEFLQKKLEEEFDILKPIVKQDKEINDRFNRMVGHYNDYKESFEQAILEKNKLKKLNNDIYVPLAENTHALLDSITQTLLQQENFKAAYQVSHIERELYQTSSYIDTFQKTPDAVLIRDTRATIEDMRKGAKETIEGLENQDVIKDLQEFESAMEQYQSVFKDITRFNRSYLNLVNVVLAGKAAEIDRLSKELDGLILQHSKVLTARIEDNIKSSQKQFIILSISAGVIGFLSSIVIAMGISRPVSAMATTLSTLSTGKADIEIPGQERKDEVGQMAKAANEFKVMAKNLEYQTEELEEFAYRTSHDLRSPLVSSIGLLKLTQGAIDDEKYDKAKKSIKLISSSLEKLEMLVKDILELTKTKNASEEKTDIDLENIINDMIQRFSHMDNFECLNIQKDLKFTDNFMSQKSRIVLILENLFSNAVKYQDPEKEKPYIKISTYCASGKVVIDIEDNGLGIPEKHQSELFSMFKRFHPKISFGSGLGLYMMKKSADVIDADLVYEDTGTGSIFKLFIPIENEEK